MGGLTSQRIKFQFACSKFWRKNGKHARESNGSKRGFYSYFIAVHYFLSKTKTSKSNFTAVPDFSRDSMTTKSRNLSILDYFCVATKTTAQTCSKGSSWFETLFHSNALNMWWKENFRVSRETFNFICATVGPVIQRQDTIC